MCRHSVDTTSLFLMNGAVMRKKITNSMLAKLSVSEGKASIRVFDTEIIGFGVRVMASGVASFIFERRPKGSRVAKRITIGRVNDLTIESARKRALHLANEFTSPDYLSNKAKIELIPTFSSVVNNFEELHFEGKSPRYKSETMGYLRRYAIKPLGSLKLDQVSRANVANIITPLMQSGRNPTAQSIWGAVSAVLTFSVRFGYLEGNPLIGSPPNFNKRSRDRVLSIQEISDIWRSTKLLNPQHLSIVRLLILIPARKTELLGSQWAEISNNWLTIPAKRTKNSDPTSLYLSEFSSKQLPLKRNDTELLFTTNGRTPMVLGSKVKNKLKTELDLPQWQFHDFRRTFSTIMNELIVDHAAIEACLNHRDVTRRGVAGIYNRSEYKERKQFVLQKWSDIVEEAVGRD
ncbi:MAG: DUF4102 domain-containing protein [SAR116 cluster bacterium]|nr:MAG: DUF4102 domain-containing protein [SAR116 cluster bacterium]